MKLRRTIENGLLILGFPVILLIRVLLMMARRLVMVLQGFTSMVFRWIRDYSFHIFVILSLLVGIFLVVAIVMPIIRKNVETRHALEQRKIDTSCFLDKNSEIIYEDVLYEIKTLDLSEYGSLPNTIYLRLEEIKDK